LECRRYGSWAKTSRKILGGRSGLKGKHDVEAKTQREKADRPSKGRGGRPGAKKTKAAGGGGAELEKDAKTYRPQPLNEENR